MIVLFILIGGIFLISSNDLVYMFLSIELQSYGQYIFSILHRNYEIFTTEVVHYFSDPCLLAAMVPIKIYSNAEAEKDKILSDNKNKSGIYMWKNLINKKQYIDYSENLIIRFRQYFNINHLIRYNCMHICRALLKHEYSNFSLTILEYCEREKLLIREKHYWHIFNPEYNISQDPTAPMSGRNHSEESKTKISDSLTGEKNPMFGKNHSDKTKQIMSDAKKGENHPMYGKNHSDDTKKIMSDAKKGEKNPMYNKQRASGAGRPSNEIEVTDIKNNITTSYDSIREAAKALNINHTRIVIYLKKKKIKRSLIKVSILLKSYNS